VVIGAGLGLDLRREGPALDLLRLPYVTTVDFAGEGGIDSGDV
jgi:hypothetical protein